MKQQSSYDQSDIRNDDATSANYGSVSSGTSSSGNSGKNKVDSTNSNYSTSGKNKDESSTSANYGSKNSGSSGSYSSGKNKGVGEYRSFVADIEDLIKATTSLSGEDLAHAKEALYKRIQAAKDSMEEVGSAISDRARRSAAATNSYVKENPWQAIGIGAAVGLLLGVVVARR